MLHQYNCDNWCVLIQPRLSRPHSRPPAAQEEDEDEERNITSSTSAESHNLVVEAGADASSHQLPSAGEEGDEGSCELSDEVSRDSTMGSDSDTFSSPFCLSPVSEALCESSGSVFLDNETRSVACSSFMIHIEPQQQSQSDSMIKLHHHWSRPRDKFTEFVGLEFFGLID